MGVPYVSTVVNGASTPLTLANPTLATGLNSIGDNSAMVEIWAGSVAPVGLQLAFDGSLDGGVTWNVPLGGIRTDTGAIETGNNTLGYFAVPLIPSAWRLQTDQLTNVRVRVVGLTSGGINATIKAGSFYTSQPLAQLTALLAGGSIDTPNAVLWELDQIRLALCQISVGGRADYVTPPASLPLPAIYQAGTNS